MDSVTFQTEMSRSVVDTSNHRLCETGLLRTTCNNIHVYVQSPGVFTCLLVCIALSISECPGEPTQLQKRRLARDFAARAHKACE